jgi:predicted Zn-dependent protease
MSIARIHFPTRPTAFVIVLLVLFGGAVRAKQGCAVTPVLKIPSGRQIFNPQQERTLGDVEAEWVGANYPVVQEERLTSHLDAVASRVLSQFPAELAQVQVILVDIPIADAFSAGPNRIYITRKMVTLLNNDDELAGLLGHELGHLLTHQNAVTVTELFHEILGVDVVADRNDISEKLSRMMARIDEDKKAFHKAAQVIQRQEGIHQCEADRVAIYAAAGAGFSPQAYVELFDRSAKTSGSKDTPLADSFEAAGANKWRLHEIQNTLKRLPQACRGSVPTPSAEFLSWQAAVLSSPDLARR